jgi:hypothetical protein
MFIAVTIVRRSSAGEESGHDALLNTAQIEHACGGLRIRTGGLGAKPTIIYATADSLPEYVTESFAELVARLIPAPEDCNEPSQGA